jgi:hypothetical protein
VFMLILKMPRRYTGCCGINSHGLSRLRNDELVPWALNRSLHLQTLASARATIRGHNKTKKVTAKMRIFSY